MIQHFSELKGHGFRAGSPHNDERLSTTGGKNSSKRGSPRNFLTLAVKKKILKASRLGDWGRKRKYQKRISKENVRGSKRKEKEKGGGRKGKEKKVRH